MTEYHLFNPRNGKKLYEVKANSRKDAAAKYFARKEAGTRQSNRVKVIAANNYEILTPSSTGFSRIDSKRFD